jgi:hypothetical protein
VALDALADQMDELEIVKTMRAHALKSREEEGGWLEIDVMDNTTEDIIHGGKRTRPLVQRAMAGIQGLGIQRAFWNSETGELVGVIWIGPRLSGWPGIAHGGAIATIFEEIMSRVIAGPNVSVGMLWRRV